MATEEKHGNREIKKSKRLAPKTNAAAPSTKGKAAAAVKSIDQN